MSTNETAVIKSTLVIVNGELDQDASIEKFKVRMAEWMKENAKAKVEDQNEERIKELTQHDKIAETSAKVMGQFGKGRVPRDLYMSELLSSLTCSDGTKGTHPDLYHRVKVEVEAWFKGQKDAGKFNVSKGKSGGVQAVAPMSELAAAAE